MKTEYSNYEIILVDNNSTDGSIDFISKNFKNNLRLIKLDKNYGFSRGNNIGSRYARGEYLVFLNPDTKVEHNWLDQMIMMMQSNPSVGIAQPKILFFDEKHFDSTGGFIDCYGRVEVRGTGEMDIGQYEKTNEIFYAKGAALFIKSNVWKKLHGFDPIFFNYFEETDLCWRAWDLGHKVVYNPLSIVYHAGGGVLDSVPYHLKFNEAKGRLILLIKNHNLKNLFTCVPITFCLHFLNIFRQLFKKDAMSAKAILSGTTWCLINFKKIWIKRKENNI